MKKILLILFLITMSSTIHAQTGQESTDPSYSAEQWLSAILTQDGLNIGYYTCNADTEQVTNLVQQFFLPFNTMSFLLNDIISAVGLEPQIDLRDTNFDLSIESDDYAIVSLSGELRIAVGTTNELIDIEGIFITLIYENDRWRVCQTTPIDNQSERIFFIASHPNLRDRFYSIGIDGTDIRLIAPNMTTDYISSLSPNENYLVYTTNIIGNGHNRPYMAITNTDGSNYRQLNFGVDSIWWSPDSSNFLFTLNNQIYITDVESLETDFLANGYFASWSPNAQNIYIADDNNKCIYTYNTGNLDCSTLPNSTAGFEWSPSGNTAAFVTSGPEICTISLVSQGLHCTPELPHSISEIAWSPNEQYLATSDLYNTKEICIIHTENMVNECITSGVDFRWSPHSNFLAIQLEAYEPTIYIASPTEGIISTFEVVDMGLSFSVNENPWSPNSLLITFKGSIFDAVSGEIVTSFIPDDYDINTRWVRSSWISEDVIILNEEDGDEIFSYNPISDNMTNILPNNFLYVKIIDF